MQTSAVRTSAVQTSVMQTSAVQTSVVHTSLVQTSAMQTSAMRTSAVQTSAVQTSAVQTSAMRTSAMQTSAMRTSAVRTSAMQLETYGKLGHSIALSESSRTRQIGYGLVARITRLKSGGILLMRRSARCQTKPSSGGQSGSLSCSRSSPHIQLPRQP